MEQIFKTFFSKLTIFAIMLFWGSPLKASTLLSESFTSPFYPTETWTNGSYSLSSGSWDSQYAMGLASINAYNGSGYAVKLNRYLESYLTTPVLSSVGTISFYYRNFSTVLGGGTFKVQKSVNNGAYTDLATVTFTSKDIYTFYSLTVNDAGSNIRLRIYCPTTNTGYLCVDEITVTDIGQTLTANPSALSGINYYLGAGPSASQSFNLIGSNLTGAPGNITVIAPSDYEVSTNNTSFSSSVDVAYSSATVSAPVYVRLKAGLALGNYNSESISISGGGAPTFNVPCSGSVTVAPSPLITVSPTSLSGFNYVFGAGPSIAQSYTIIGTYLTGFPDSILVTAPSDYQLSLDYTNYYSALKIPYTGATLSSVIVYVRLKSGLAVGNYNSEAITNVGGGASSSVTCSGSVSSPASPVVSITPSTLAGFTYIAGSGPSIAQSYNINGANLTGFPDSIVVTAPANYEVSFVSGSGFTSNLKVPYTSANLTSTPIHVRLRSGLTVGTYNSELIANVGGGAATVNVTCNGSVTAIPPATLTLSSTVLTGFSYVVGSGPSAAQSYNLSGSNLTEYASGITVTAPADYEVSLTPGSGYASSINVACAGATLASTPIYVRLRSGLTVGTYNSELIANVGGGAATANVACNGSVTAIPPATLTLSSTVLTGFSYVVGSGPSAAQSYNLSGSNLTEYASGITVTAPADYEVSLTSGSGYASSINVACAGATLASTPIYVRLKSGLTVGTYNSELIANAGGGAATVNVTCNGNVSDVITGPCFSENFNNFTTGTHASPGSTDISTTLDSYTQTTGWAGSKVFSAGGEVKLGSSSAAGYLVSPAIDLSAGGSVSFDIQIFGTDAGKVQIFHAPDGVIFTQVGSDITPTAAYTTQTVQITGGTALSKIKIGTTQKRVYLDSINVICGGSVPTPLLSVSSSTFSGFTYVAGSGPSVVQSYNISGSNLDGSDVTITPSVNYEISLASGSGFASTPLVLTAFNGASTAIYVRLKSGLSVGNYNSEIIANAGGGATSVSVVCNGNVTAAPVPELVVNPIALTGFTCVAGSGPSVAQSYNISGSNLDGSDVTITPSANYEISLASGSGFVSTPLVLTAFNGASTAIYVRLKSGLSVGNYNSEVIANAGGGATSVNVVCNGNVTAAPVPELVVNPIALTGFTCVAGSGPSVAQSYNISGSHLDGSDVTITPSASYEISLASGSGFTGTPLILTAFNGTSTAVYVRLKSGLSAGNYNSEIIANAGGGANAANLICSGVVVGDVSISEKERSRSMYIHPNPANDRIVVSNISSTVKEIRLFGVTGDLISVSVVDNRTNLDIDLTALPDGIYFIYIIDEKNSAIAHKIIKM